MQAQPYVIQRHSPGSTVIESIQADLSSESPNLDETRTKLEQDLKLSSDEAQKLIYQVVTQLNAALFPPITKLEIIHTEGCNLACTYCFEKDMLGIRRMPLDIAKAAVDLLCDYSQNETNLYITHFGGEPTLNLAAIKNVTDYAEKKASLLGKTIDFHMTSNGVLFTESMVDYFAEHKINVLLSVDGLEATHDRFRLDRRGRGTFAQVMKGFALLKRVQPWVGVKMTVMPVNVPRLFADVVGLYERGVNQFIIGYATGIKWRDEEMVAYGEELRKIFRWYKETPRQDLRITDFDDDMSTTYFGCQAGRISITATVDGEISPCAKILALNNKQILSKLGDVRYGLTHLRNRFELVSCSQLRAACTTKGIADDFHGGCFASNYEDNQSLFQPSLQDHRFSILQRSACSDCTSCKS